MSENRSGDLYSSGMGKLGPNGIIKGQVELNRKGPGIDHHTVIGNGAHFSWNSGPNGNIFGEHERIHSGK